MPAVTLIAAFGLLPAFQPSPAMPDQPLLWEAPISQASPPTWQGGLDLSPQLKEKFLAAQKINKESGPAQAAASLAKAAELELILMRGGLNQSAGQLKSAQADYEKVLASKNRTAPRALALAGYKSVLRKRIADGEKNLYGDLIKCLKDEWRNEEALALIPAIMSDAEVPAAVKSRIAKEEPIMSLRLGRYDRAAELWGNASGRSEIQWLAQTENRRGNFQKAAELREGLAKTMGAGKARNNEIEAAWNFLIKGGLYDEAEALAGRHQEIKKITDYHWRSGLAALAAGRVDAARVYFEAILAQPKNKKQHSGADYFLARCYEVSGQAAEAWAIYDKLARGPFGYYHILAKGRLERPEFKSSQPARFMSIMLQSGPDGLDRQSLGYHLWISEKALPLSEMNENAQALAALSGPIVAGGKETAALNARLKESLADADWPQAFELIRRNEQAIRSAVPEARELWTPLAPSIAAWGGDYRLAVSLMARIPNAEPKGLKRWSHPLIFTEQVQAAYRRHGLPPSLLLALIRTESAYQADIMSASNARGLMQLLPATANKVAAAQGEAEPGAVDLFNPVLNIRYGAWYLAALIDGFDSVELALAGYNGGPYNIKSMIEAKEGMPLDIFIELLPFDETCRYVKRITESRYIYEMVYFGQADSPNLTGPIKKPKPSLPEF